ncbi:hypothetical protein AB6P12_08875 [Streptococcus mutans]|uniref:hypothetical protein n=1 Tax=Streptococcus mutans TaxID=1309 RepID=UPI0028E531A5|nr:hypothetical protein [Streptococcus mutans]MDT9490045.1 hypothetical protein [Streptococcus mutans]
MKRTFFQKTIDLSLNLLIFGFLCFFLKFGIGMFIQTLGSIPLSTTDETFIFFKDKLVLVNRYLQIGASVFIVVSLLLIVIELFQRLTQDSLWNYVKSLYQTFRIRQFLKQDNQSEPIITVENQTVTRFNPILKSFNQAVSKCTVDVRKDAVNLFIKIPKTQQAQKLLKEMEGHIKEEIASRNPSYYFSSAHRVKNALWFTGARR